MGKAYALCQHYKTYTQIEGQTRRRKITRARRRKEKAVLRRTLADIFVVKNGMFTVYNDLSRD